MAPIPPTSPDSSSSEALAVPEALLDALPWGVLVLDAPHVIRRLNQQAAAWCGAPAGALVGQPLAGAPLPEGVVAALTQLLTTGVAGPDVWLPHAQQWVSMRPGPAPAGQHWVFWEDATARHQAETAQQRSVQLLLDMEAVAHTGSYEADLSTGSFYFSDGMYHLFGEDPPTFELTLDVIDARSHPADAAAIRQVLDEAVRTRQPYTYRRRIRRADGQWRTLEAHGEVRCDAAGHAVQLRGLVQDVTERVQAEQALHQSHELLRRTIDSSLEMVQVFEAVRDEQGAVVDFTWVLNNTAAERWYGDVIGQRLCELNPGVVAEGIFDTFRRVLETGVPDQSERHYQHEQFDGWFYQSVVKLGDGVTTTTRDISVRKKAEQTLLASQHLVQTVFDVSLNPIAYHRAVRDAAGRIVDFEFQLENREARQYAVADRRGQRFSTAYPGILDTTVFQFYCAVVETGQPLNTEVQLRLKGQERWFHLVAGKLDDGLVASAIDVTERKQSEAEILRLKEEMARRATDKYHALLGATTQGFCLLQLLFEETGQQAVDFRYLEMNPAFVEHSGLPADAQGKTVRELVPDLEPLWLETYGRVALTGQPERLEYHVAQLGRWYDAHAFRMGPPEARQVGVLFSDVTARKQGEQRQQFLLRLADALRPLVDPLAIATTACRLLVEHLAASRAQYVQVEGELENETGVVQGEYIRRGQPMPRRHRFTDYGEPVVAVLRAGQTLVLTDTAHDPRLTEDQRAAYAAAESPAAIATPLVKGGRLAAVFTVHHAEPRPWTAAEVALAGEVAERTWAAVERAKAETALHLSEARLRALITNLPGAAVFVVDRDLRYQLAGGEALEAAGFRPADLLGRTVAEAMPPSLVPQYEAHYRRALAGQGFAREHTAHGRTFISRGVPLLDPAGEPEAVLVVSYDITARKQAEEALHASQAQLALFNARLEDRVVRRTRDLQASRDLLQSVFDTNLIAMSVLEAVRNEAGAILDFRLRLVSRELARETGRADLVGKLYAQEYPGIRDVGIFDLAVRAVETGEPQSMEYFYPHEGFNKWFACQFVKLGDGVVATNLDITARKQAEDERFKNLQLLQQAESLVGLGSWEYDLRSEQFTWSAGMYNLFGIPLGQPVQLGIIFNMVTEEGRPQVEYLRTCIRTGACDIKETVQVHVNGQVRTVRIRAVVMHDEQGQPQKVLGMNLDISELKRLEANNLHLRLTQQQALFEAVQAAQEAERKRMAESLHNGIGQILYATKLRLDRLHAPLLGIAPALVKARAEADQLLSEAIRQTRALSHELVPLVLEEFGLAAALQDIASKMSTPRLRLRSHIELDADAVPLALPLQMALYRMAQELAQNIVKHAHGATTATLELETMPGWVLLRAEDNGPGFPATPAEQAGLGLRSIRDRVALLGGELETGAAAGGGAYVRIRIPLPEPPTP
ncbi:PAS domain-containing protein [Microvirga sp. STS02]|uniref:PAS domain-containing protein n=1 Tax=Hymenobacter negativus TaxID=2795026 RepID=UPI0018DB0E9F|nr:MULTISPECIES: PAS domain-containing protein [Bacteria]MBH8568070.1 PAS domain-containing protein [Hymenobacter negativus]MBR7207804.1 PAS domain-containing protein [Microvirga sp. STS02]